MHFVMSVNGDVMPCRVGKHPVDRPCAAEVATASLQRRVAVSKSLRIVELWKKPVV
jgi:hypothetical protein